MIYNLDSTYYRVADNGTLLSWLAYIGTKVYIFWFIKKSSVIFQIQFDY